MTDTPSTPRLALLDGHGIIFRAFFAQAKNPLSVRATGELTGAVYGFANALLKVISDLKPTHLAVTMDRAAPTFRHQADVNYKANRPQMPSELPGQIRRVRELIDAFNIPIYEADGFEADDMLGTLARQAAERDIDTYLVTLDSDIVQLVEPPVKVFMYLLHQRDTIIYDGAERVQERYGVRPGQIPDLKALKGDTSDNIPGVPGIGEKTAVTLLKTFASVENIFEFLHQVTPAKVQQALRDNEAQVRASKDLATIRRDCDVELDLDRCRVDAYDRNRVVELFRDLEFRSLLPRLPDADLTFSENGRAEAAGENHPVEYTVITTLDQLDAVVARIRDAGRVTLDTETTSQNAMQARLVGISLSVEPYEAWYIPVGHAAADDPTRQLPLETVLDRLRPLLADPAIGKTAHNFKFDETVLDRAGVPIAGLAHDTMIMAYLIGETQLGLKALAFSELGEEMTPITDLIGTGKAQITMDQVPVARAAPYASADADLTTRLLAELTPKLRDAGQWELYEAVEIPLVPILGRMERRGVTVDTDILREISRTLGEEQTRLEQAFYEAAGRQVNIGSPKQMSQLFFEELNLPKTRKTALGWSTDAMAMDFLRGKHPAVDLLFEYREVAKLKSTYVDSLPGLINPDTGRIHTTYNQTRAATGRLSSENPNLQNIPNRTEQGRLIRRAFVGRDGDKPLMLLKADYSQVELRILAHLSGEPFLIEAFGRDDDIHRATAAKLFSIPPEAVSREQRDRAKMINFATIYGLSANGLSQRSELSYAEAADFIRAYFANLPKVKEYLDGTIALVRAQGYAETLMGRRRQLPDITSANGQLRAAAERMATNAPVQGTNSDIIKVAMIEMQKAMDAAKLQSHMLLQVHDELVFECPEGELETMRALCHRVMPAAMQLAVPLKVEVKVGPNWGEME